MKSIVHPYASVITGIVSHTEKQLTEIVGQKVLVKISCYPPITEAEIRELVIEESQLGWNVITYKVKEGKVVSARQLYCWLCSTYLPELSNGQIGEQVNIKPCGALRAVRKVDDMLSINDPYFTEAVNNIQRKIFKL